MAGAIAGISGAIVSAPADLLLTNSQSVATVAVTDPSGPHIVEPELSDTEAPTNEPAEGGLLEGVFAGVGVRCVFFAASIAVQVS